ncbi:MAG: FAD-binding oxidoreductase, partial [Chloroflexi bacterium]|nr:FAD-binding oxidoreductase [Chloroflexota bacterium]
MEAIGGHGVPGAPESYWLASSPGTGYPPLEGEVETDVVIVGGGFAGIISALFLKEAGFKVAVIEARRILTGVTGNTTAKITSLHRLVYANLVKSLGQEKARQYADANQAAIEKLAALVEARKIPCDFSRLPFYVYAADRKDVPRLEQEVKAAQSVGLEASFVDEVALPFATAGAIRLDNQAQFHPLKFLREIARSLPGEGSHIFENSRVIRMDHGPVCRASTDKGRVKARYAVVATNFPVLDREGFFYARLQPARSYAIAGMTDRAF